MKSIAGLISAAALGAAMLVSPGVAYAAAPVTRNLAARAVKRRGSVSRT